MGEGAKRGIGFMFRSRKNLFSIFLSSELVRATAQAWTREVLYELAILTNSAASKAAPCMYGPWAATGRHVPLALFIDRTLRNRNVTTRQATTNTDNNMARPATNDGTLMHTLSADSPDRVDMTTVSPLPLPLPLPVPLPLGTFRAKLTSPGATTCMTRLVFTSSSGLDPVDRRCLCCLPVPSMSTDRGRPPNDTRFMCCPSSDPPPTVPCLLTVAYVAPCPGNGGGGRFSSSSCCS